MGIDSCMNDKKLAKFQIKQCPSLQRLLDAVQLGVLAAVVAGMWEVGSVISAAPSHAKHTDVHPCTRPRPSPCLAHRRQHQPPRRLRGVMRGAVCCAEPQVRGRPARRF